MIEKKLYEVWAEFCFHLSDNVNPSINENMFEYKVLHTLEKLGWSQFKGELKVRKPIQIGRQNFITPDVVVCTPDNKPVIVLELKRPSEDLSKADYFGQLKSYMRQTKADFGLLIGNEIHIYYDGPLNKHNDLLLLSKIRFISDCEEGANFVALFNRNSFIEGQYNTYLKAHIDRLEHEQHIASVRETLQSEETTSKICKFLQSELKDINPLVLLEAMQGMVVKISYQQAGERGRNLLFDDPVSTITEPDTIFVCKNIKSGNYFVYLEDVNGNDVLLINSEGEQVVRNADLFDQPQEKNVDYLKSYKLITELQLKTYEEYEGRQSDNTNMINHELSGRIKRATYTPKAEGRKSPSPSASEWSKGVPELATLGGRVTWKAICDYLKVDVGVDSARRVLKDWASVNRREWPTIPEP